MALVGLSVGSTTSLLKAGMYSFALVVARRFHDWSGSSALPKMGSLGLIVF